MTSDLHAGDVPCDLSTADGPAKLIAEVSRIHGPITALVLSHAHDVESEILDTTAESLDQHFAVNARAALLLIAAFARQIGATGGAVIAFTSDHTTGNLPYQRVRGVCAPHDVRWPRLSRRVPPSEHVSRPTGFEAIRDRDPAARTRGGRPKNRILPG